MKTQETINTCALYNIDEALWAAANVRYANMPNGGAILTVIDGHVSDGHQILARFESSAAACATLTAAGFRKIPFKRPEQFKARLIASAPETAAERDRLREALRQIQNNAAARKWNSESVDRADLDAWTTIETKAKAALAGLPDPDPAQRVRDAAPELLEACKAALAVLQGYVHGDKPEMCAMAEALEDCHEAIARATGGEI